MKRVLQYLLKGMYRIFTLAMLLHLTIEKINIDILVVLIPVQVLCIHNSFLLKPCQIIIRSYHLFYFCDLLIDLLEK